MPKVIGPRAVAAEVAVPVVPKKIKKKKAEIIAYQNPPPNTEPELPARPQRRPTMREAKARAAVDPEVIEGNGMPRFNNRMFKFPNQLKGIDILIARGDKTTKVQNYLITNSSGAIAIPNLKTIALYIKWRLPELKKKNAAKMVLDEMVQMENVDGAEIKAAIQRLNMSSTDVGDRKALIEKLMKCLLIRFQKLSQIQDTIMDARNEQVMTNQLQAIHRMAETLMNKEDDLAIYDWIARRIIEKFLSEIGPVLKASFEKNADPARMGAFIEDFMSGANALDTAKMKQEAVNEANELTKSGGFNGRG